MPNTQLRRFEELLASVEDGSLDVDEFARAFRVLWLEQQASPGRLSSTKQRLIDSVGEAIGTFDRYRGIKATGADADGLRRLASSVLRKLRGEQPLEDSELPDDRLDAAPAPSTLLRSTMSDSHEAMMADLTSSERDRRRRAADYFDDLFNRYPHRLPDRRGAVGRIAEALVGAALAETDAEVRDRELAALAGADDLPFVVVEPLVGQLPSFSDTEIRLCLAIFGSTRGGGAEAIVAGYLDHADGRVRDDATDTLVRLRARRRHHDR